MEKGTSEWVRGDKRTSYLLMTVPIWTSNTKAESQTHSRKANKLIFSRQYFLRIIDCWTETFLFSRLGADVQTKKGRVCQCLNGQRELIQAGLYKVAEILHRVQSFLPSITPNRPFFQQPTPYEIHPLFFIWVCAILTKVNCWRLFQPSAPTAQLNKNNQHSKQTNPKERQNI